MNTDEIKAMKEAFKIYDDVMRGVDALYYLVPDTEEERSLSMLRCHDRIKEQVANMVRIATARQGESYE